MPLRGWRTSSQWVGQWHHEVTHEVAERLQRCSSWSISPARRPAVLREHRRKAAKSTTNDENRVSVLVFWVGLEDQETYTHVNPCLLRFEQLVIRPS